MRELCEPIFGCVYYIAARHGSWQGCGRARLRRNAALAFNLREKSAGKSVRLYLCSPVFISCRSPSSRPRYLANSSHSSASSTNSKTCRPPMFRWPAWYCCISAGCVAHHSRAAESLSVGDGHLDWQSTGFDEGKSSGCGMRGVRQSSHRRVHRDESKDNQRCAGEMLPMAPVFLVS